MLKKVLSPPRGRPSSLSRPASWPRPRRRRKPFPVVLGTPMGKLTIRKQPRRIVSLSPRRKPVRDRRGSRVVAVDELSNYPPERAPRTKLSGFTPNAEAIAGFRPDLVIVHGRRADGVARQARHPVLVQPAASKLAQAYAQVTQLGRATGHRKGAAATVLSLQARISKALKSVLAAPSPCTTS